MNLKEYIKKSKMCHMIDIKTVTVLYQLNEFDAANKLELLYYLQRVDTCLEAKTSMALMYWKFSLGCYKLYASKVHIRRTIK